MNIYGIKQLNAKITQNDGIYWYHVNPYVSKKLALRRLGNITLGLLSWTDQIIFPPHTHNFYSSGCHVYKLWQSFYWQKAQTIQILKPPPGESVICVNQITTFVLAASLSQSLFCLRKLKM